MACEDIYAIVLFLPRTESNNLIDLVPSSWVSKKGHKVTCRYPGQPEFKTLSKMVSSLQEAKKEWKCFPIEIISYARDLEQAKRRLKRAYKTMDVQSTEDAGFIDVAGSEMPVVLNKDDLQRELLDVDPLIADNVDNIGNIAETLEAATIHANNKSTLECNEGNSAGNIMPGTQEYIRETRNLILAAINSAKRSILYNVDKKVNDIKNAIEASTEMPKENLNSIKDKLGVALPIKTIEEFLSFEEMIATTEEKKQALIHFYRILVCGETCIKNCVKKIMTATLSKTIEMEYSAFGKLMRGVGKRNFSLTNTYSCLNQVLLDKYGSSDEYKDMKTVMSRWLSGASDRDGGRKKRKE